MGVIHSGSGQNGDEWPGENLKIILKRTKEPVSFSLSLCTGSSEQVSK